MPYSENALLTFEEIKEISNSKDVLPEKISKNFLDGIEAILAMSTPMLDDTLEENTIKKSRLSNYF